MEICHLSVTSRRRKPGQLLSTRGAESILAVRASDNDDTLQLDRCGGAGTFIGHPIPKLDMGIPWGMGVVLQRTSAASLKRLRSSFRARP